MKKIDIVIPFYNEEKVLDSVIKNLLKIKIWNLILVNDGSSDNSAFVASKFNVTLLNHSKNYGQGAALRTGVMYSLNNNSDYICTFDADGQHDVNDLLKMVDYIIKTRIQMSF
jgi:glycosyltransferase involved in cell wall biosynthesis